MNRRVVGAVVAAIGALGVAASSYLLWYGGREPNEIPLAQLIQAGDAGATSDYWGSVAAALGIVGILGPVGALLQSRFLLVLAWLVGAGVTGLLWVMLTIGDLTSPSDPDLGVLVCLSGLAVLLLGIFVMGPRRDAVEAPLSMFDGDPPQ